MTTFVPPAERYPKGDHNRRLSLGIDLEQFADAAGISPEALHEYENTQPDHDFDPDVAQRVGSTLERLEAILPNSEAAGIRQELEAKGASTADSAFDQSVRDTAYLLWQSEGRPEGRDQEYWYRAQDIVAGQEAMNAEFREAVEYEPPEGPPPEIAERAAEASRKIGLERPFRRDPSETTSGGFNQKR